MEMEIEIEREGDGLEVLSMERGGGAPRNSRPRRKIGQDSSVPMGLGLLYIPLFLHVEADFAGNPSSQAKRNQTTSHQIEWTGHEDNPTAMATSSMVNLTAIIALLIAAAAAASDPPPATAYTNHTVGGSDGWLYDAAKNASATNYSAWAATQTFNLGDFLIFNTNSNSTVIQTSNDTTYQSCSWDDSQDNDTIQYDGGDQQFGKALTIAVPLTIEGPNYYFSDADDSIQCQSGMAFEIQVHYGLGLPPSLNQPPPPPYIEPPGHGFAQSPPITVTTSPGNGGFRAAANVLGVFSVLLHLLPFSILIF